MSDRNIAAYENLKCTNDPNTHTHTHTHTHTDWLPDTAEVWCGSASWNKDAVSLLHSLISPPPPPPHHHHHHRHRHQSLTPVFFLSSSILSLACSSFFQPHLLNIILKNVSQSTDVHGAGRLRVKLDLWSQTVTDVGFLVDWNSRVHSVFKRERRSVLRCFITKTSYRGREQKLCPSLHLFFKACWSSG